MRVLAPLGCYRGRVDGVAGDLFRRAVIGYQRSQLFPVGGLHPDGSWATRTQAHYDWVQQLQCTLNASAGDDIAVDGDYRTVTGGRVRNVQQRNHGGAYPAACRVDGEPGPVFCRMLGVPVHPAALEEPLGLDWPDAGKGPPMANAMRTRLEAGRTVFNGWVTVDSAHVAEELSWAGYETVTIDVQHGMFGLGETVNLLRAVCAGPAMPMVRASGNDPAELGKLLDAGALAVICPIVNTREECERFVSACLYPPLGTRSLGPTRAVLAGGADYALHANEEITTWAMVETREAMANLDDILATPHLYGVFIGPNDLALDHGFVPDGHINSDTMAMISDITERAHAAGLRVGAFCAGVEEALRLEDLGVEFLTPSHDMGLLRRAARETLDAVRAGR